MTKAKREKLKAMASRWLGIARRGLKQDIEPHMVIGLFSSRRKGTNNQIIHLDVRLPRGDMNAAVEAREIIREEIMERLITHHFQCVILFSDTIMVTVPNERMSMLLPGETGSAFHERTGLGVKTDALMSVCQFEDGEIVCYTQPYHRDKRGKLKFQAIEEVDVVDNETFTFFPQQEREAESLTKLVERHARN